MEKLKKLRRVCEAAINSKCNCPDDGLPHEADCTYSNSHFKLSKIFNLSLIAKLLDVVEAAKNLRKKEDDYMIKDRQSEASLKRLEKAAIQLDNALYALDES